MRRPEDAASRIFNQHGVIKLSFDRVLGGLRGLFVEFDLPKRSPNRNEVLLHDCLNAERLADLKSVIISGRVGKVATLLLKLESIEAGSDVSGHGDTVSESV